MRKSCAPLIAFFVLTSVLAVAQSYPKAEVYGGYSYLNADTTDLGIDRQSLNGWEASVSGNFNRWFAVEGSVSGYYKTYSADLSSVGFGVVNLKVTDYSYAAGPRLNFKPLFVHALFGGDHLTGTVSGTSVSGASESQDGIAGIFGGGVQIKVAPRISVRASADYVYTRHNIFGGPSATQNNIRAGVGVVYSFGGERAVTQGPSNAPRPSGASMPIPQIGVRVMAAQNGAEIVEVAPGSLADLANMKARDVITSVDGKPVHSPTELEAELSSKPSGQKVSIGFSVRGMWHTDTVVVIR